MTESEWKIFRQLREVALHRFCQRILSEITALAADTTKSNHERYLAIYDHIRERNEELAYAFDNPRRSTAMQQLAAIRYRGLLNEEEFGRFNEKTRQTINALLNH